MTYYNRRRCEKIRVRDQYDDRYEKNYERRRSRERYENGRSRERYENGRSRERYERGRSRERYERGRSRERYVRGRSQESYENRKSRERYDRKRIREEDNDENECIGLTIEVKQAPNGDDFGHGTERGQRRGTEKNRNRDKASGGGERFSCCKAIVLISLGIIIIAASILGGIYFFMIKEKNVGKKNSTSPDPGYSVFDDDKFFDDGIFLPSDVRFNKFLFFDDTYHHLVPLDSKSYPISSNNNVSKFLKEASNSVSVVNDKEDYEIIYNIEELIQYAGGLPDHPGENNTAVYWEKLINVIEMSLINSDAKASASLEDKLTLPRSWNKYTIRDIVEAVGDEKFPGQQQAMFLQDLVSGKYGEIEYDYDIIPKRSNSQLLHGIIMLASINLRTIEIAGAYAFGAKWFIGRARPEEVAWLIKTGRIHAPKKVHRKINQLRDFTSAEAFTKYREGAPSSPSWPSMHAASSTISFWLQIVMNLTPEQLCEAKKLDYAVGFARTVASTNFEDDNIAGLDIGQEVVARSLPSLLATNYRSSAWIVLRKVRRKRFRWEDYDPLKPCHSN